MHYGINIPEVCIRITYRWNCSYVPKMHCWFTNNTITSYFHSFFSSKVCTSGTH